MGAEQSSSNNRKPDKKYSQDDVDRILRNEKLRMEQNYKDEIARNAARQKVEGLLLQNKNQATSSAPSSSLETSNNRKPKPDKGYSTDEVNRFLRNEKLRMEQNYKDEIARNAARQKVEGLLLQSKNQATSSAPSPSLETSSASKPSTYSFTQNELHLLVAKPTVSPNPNADNVRSPSERSNLASNATNNNRTSPQTPGNVTTTIIDTEAQRVPKNEQPKTTHVDADEDDELNCYTCKSKYTLNIYQCPRGHSSCHLCRASMALCGVCGSPVGDIRNNALEAYIAQRKTRCPNSKDGCCMLIKMADLEAHTRQCLFRELACPLADIFGLCRWRGKLQQISKHFDKTHPLHRTGKVDTEMAVSLNDTQIVHLVVVGTFHFLFHIKVCEQRRAAYMVVQLIGTKHGASKWSYEIYVYNKSEPQRKYHYTDVCQSINTPVTQIIADENCVTLPFDYIETFMNNNRLNYKFYIKRDIESTSTRYPAWHGGARSRNRSWVRRQNN